MELGDLLQPFPFDLPAGFVEQLGYRGVCRFVAAHWDAGDELAIRDDAFLLVGADRYPYLAVIRQREVRAWLWEHSIDLGSSDAPATHWLIVDRETDDGYIAPVEEAAGHIQQQRLGLVE